MARANRLSRRADLRRLADEELMALVHDGQAGAFEVIFDRHGGASFSLAYRMCGGQALAEDVVQEAFLSLWRSGARYDRARGSVRSWVLAVVHNRAIDALRRGAVGAGRDLHEPSLGERVAAGESTETEVLRRDEARALRGVLDGLSADQREVIELAYFGGFTHVQIAEMLALPLGTVKGRMRLGLTSLRADLDASPGVAI
jgi:RNA polymerase sigma-70 factor (ECF subfamily)